MLQVFLLSLAPIVELRGAIPLGLLVLGLPWPEVLVLGVVGSFIPAIFIVGFLRKGLLILDRYPIGSRLSRLVKWFVRRRARPVEKWGGYGLVALVAIPLPFTGAWTGAIVASALGLELKKALVCIFGGLVIAGGIVTGLSLLGG